MKLLGIGVRQAKEAAHSRTVRKAKEEVQRELEAFYALHPEARRPPPRRCATAAVQRAPLTRREQRAQHVVAPAAPSRASECCPPATSR